ncbi:MAG: hypothetical protein J4N30_02360 [Chloroflexi bacterium]|nr:hypothetical protein [Chloroflexota bacterium]MCI0887027.1 hypothetical protein [Chloroflexota bacterium]
MVLVGEIVVVLGFMLFMKLFGLVGRTKRVAEVAKSALEVIRDSNLDDLQKEKATQRYAKELFSLFFVIAAVSLTALAIPLGIVWTMELANLLTVAEVIEGTLTLQFIGIAAVLSVIMFVLSKYRFG